MHLAVLPGDGAVFVDDHGGIVVQPRRAALEERRDDDDTEFFCDRGKGFRGGPGIGSAMSKRAVSSDWQK